MKMSAYQIVERRRLAARVDVKEPAYGPTEPPLPKKGGEPCHTR